ncbi:cytochrome P450 CYP72A219-like [Sesamum indicum]|uniref:Cytochrome P450 CYP72A219-like n=1 Tax=Sesamum indicum TaxID=4182 RepID=A0A6I9U101_SESIN|nr:cytochrome P450 CYP72A219-like [Sesamum indicum]
MWASILISTLLVVLLHTAWRFLNWVWIKPRKLEKLLRKQGFKGNSYRFLFGDAREAAKLYEEAYSKPIGITDDVTLRAFPLAIKTIRTYGEKSFMWVGPIPVCFVMDLDAIKIILNKFYAFQKSFKASNPIFKRLVGGLIVYEGEQWSRNRKKLNPAFHMEKLKEIVATMHTQATEILDEWSSTIPKDGSSHVVDVYPYFKHFTGCVVSYALFSSTPTPLVKRTFNIISELTHISNQSQPFSIPGEQYLPIEKYRRANEIEDELTATFTRMAEERLAQRRAGERKLEPDLFDLVVDEVEEVDIKDKKGRAAAMYELIQQCKLFYVAGHESTANLIAWTTVMLAHHQDWQTRIREEVFRVLGDRDITGDDLSSLKTLTMFIHEVMRLYPPAIELSRVVEEETTVGDITFPKGAMVMMPIILLHRNTRIWGDDASEFKPERFSEGVLKAANGRAAFIPFGWGLRTCIGANLSVIEAKVFTALFLRQFSFELAPTYSHTPTVAILLQPQYGIPLILRKL